MSIYLLFTFISFMLYVQSAMYMLYKLPLHRGTIAFLMVICLFAIYSLSIFLLQQQHEYDRLFVYDKISVISIIGASVMINVSLLFFRNVGTGWLTKPTIYFLMMPLAMLLMVGYIFEYESIKLFVSRNDTWYFQIYRNNVWAYLFVVFVVLCLALSLWQVYRWHSLKNTNRERIQTRIVFLSLWFFTVSTLIIDVIIPNWDFYLVPPMVHIIGIPPILGVLYALTDTRFHRFPEEIISEFVIKKLPAIVLFFDARGQVSGGNHYGLKILGYGGLEIQEFAAEVLFANKNDGRHILQHAREGNPVRKRTVNLLTKEGDLITTSASCARISDRFNKCIGLAFVASQQDQMHPLENRLAALKQKEESLQMQHSELMLVMQQRKRDMGIARAKLNNEINEKRQSELQINNSVKEHIELIKEIHHRVKNNLQIIISLTNFGALGYHADSEYSRVFLKIIDRLRHISAIHDNCYASPLLSKIPFGEYLESVIATIQHQNHDAQNLVFKLHVTNELVSVNQALPCGIIVNELVQNAMTFAFPNVEMDDESSETIPVIGIVFSKPTNEQYSLVVRDNGVGIPKNWMEERTTGTGLQLVYVLVNDYLKGSISVVNSFGTCITVTFP